MNWIKNNKVTLILLFIILLGSALRIYDLGTESVWHDETLSIAASEQSLTSLAVRPDVHPPTLFHAPPFLGAPLWHHLHIPHI